jgi:hypothetical protein
MCWLPQTSGYSYLRVTAIKIDVHPAGENLTNMTRTLPMPVHVRPVYAFYGQSPYAATFYEPSIELDRLTVKRKKGFRHNP